MTVSQLIPAACEAVLSLGQPQPVSAFAYDQQGSKFAMGSFSYYVNLYDYMKMDSTLRPFRDMLPCESHVINDLAYNYNGERLLLVSGEAIIRILDRKGQQFCESIRGDQYLVDVSLTKGHTASISACCWNPIVKNEFLTASDDGYVHGLALMI